MATDFCNRISSGALTCTMEYIPHCGTDGRTYQNSCSFNAARCFNENLQLTLPPGELCLVIEEPNRETPSNSISVKSSTVNGEPVSQPPSPTQEFCSKAQSGFAPCTMEYKPHCGTNSRSYGNLCYFNIARCLDESLQLALSAGEPCAETDTPMREERHLGIEPVPQLPKPSNEFCAKIKSAPCTMEYKPHCGTNGRTYGNLCYFNKARCSNESLQLALPQGTPCSEPEPSSITKRELTSESVPQPPKPNSQFCAKTQAGFAPCTTEYKPHCGTNGRTYDNSCHFNIARCLDESLELAAPSGQPCINTQFPPITVQRQLSGEEASIAQPPGPTAEFCLQATAGVIPCRLDYMPHCGSDGKTRSNLCAFQLARCFDETLKLNRPPGEPCAEASAAWQPPSPSAAFCERSRNAAITCTRDYTPHCGTDGRTYVNLCQFSIAKCANPGLQLGLAVGEPCVETPISDPPKLISSRDGVPQPVWPDKEFCDRVRGSGVACMKKFDPHCGRNGKTYPNLCQFNAARCFMDELQLALPAGVACPEGLSPHAVATKRQLDSAVPQPAPPTPEFCRRSFAGDVACSREYIPHCGTDGRSYSNLCNFDIARCANEDLQLALPAGEVCRDTDFVQPEAPDPDFCEAVESGELTCPKNDGVQLCGTDGSSYQNICYFNIARCLYHDLKLAKPAGYGCEANHVEL